MYRVQAKMPSGEDSQWVTHKETGDLNEARTVKAHLDLYYRQVQIIERTTEESVIE